MVATGSKPQRRSPGKGCQGTWRQAVTGNPKLDSSGLGLSKDQKESLQNSSREWAGGRQGTRDSEECAREGAGGGGCSTRITTAHDEKHSPLFKEAGTISSSLPALWSVSALGNGCVGGWLELF